jgi:hypothetical protein
LKAAQNSVEVAVDRMQDAESYAIYIDAQNELLNRQVQQLKRSSGINFAFGGVSFGIGAPLIIEGIHSDNRTMLYTGAGVALGTGLVWALGHFVFNWW